MKMLLAVDSSEPGLAAASAVAQRPWPADLIVLGSRGLSGLKRFLLGSVALEVTLHAPCSVEIVR